MVVFLLGLLLGIVVTMLARAWHGRTSRISSAPKVQTPVVPNPPMAALPGHLAVETRSPFFSLSEGEFFRTLEQALPPGYRAFPNVRLYDLFLIVAALPPQQAALASLRDEHIDFLIVVLDGHHPVAAIELMGKTVHPAEQRRRDEAKDLAFRSAGLLLLRLRAEEDHTLTSLEALLWQHLRPAQRELVI
ncbi:DUF2726 domain-containing protein [Deinococcus sp. AJ005]|uniref:DUF2726 domain-containing protein n=1 Tax=Deinococcus sp. AJ005 TaxID=2652443 RepID=UPI00125CC707|nr:DUF2726 domain-containing protein [Deinococcus sp. AJ005]QFP77068.1 DUF2726 domain-containing protein [Deinococcus sp. AJ005]